MCHLTRWEEVLQNIYGIIVMAQFKYLTVLLVS